MQVPPPAPGPALITVVESDGCHYCADAVDALARLAAAFPLRVRTVDALSEPGRELMRRHRAAMSPLVLLDDTFFSSGRLPRRKLEKALAARYGQRHG
ncbi:glutaredoxin [Nocardioides sp.]|uniref:glutaredoxin family protein n=1 Tax=Nocardioides sp. TaxID=35761 RepID=UPI002EDA24A2